MRTGFYPGSFDPLTNGHFDIIRQAVSLVDKLVIAVGIHPGKTPLFTADERMAMIHEVCGPIAKKAGSAIEAVTFDGLAVEAAQKYGATIMIRGLRDGTDLDYEMQLAGMNQVLAPDVKTVMLPASPLVRPITATLVRQIATMGGDISQFVSGHVQAKLALKFSRR